MWMLKAWFMYLAEGGKGCGLNVNILPGNATWNVYLICIYTRGESEISQKFMNSSPASRYYSDCKIFLPLFVRPKYTENFKIMPFLGNSPITAKPVASQFWTLLEFCTWDSAFCHLRRTGALTTFARRVCVLDDCNAKQAHREGICEGRYIYKNLRARNRAAIFRAATTTWLHTCARAAHKLLQVVPPVSCKVARESRLAKSNR